MRVLGIDPGLTRCGFGVVDGAPGWQPVMVAVDVVCTDPTLEVPQRLVLLERAFQQWIEQHRPDRVAVERVFAQHNLQTVMGTAQAAGVAMLVAARNDIPVALHTPSEVKAAITGSGRADKAQIGVMVTRILRLDETPKPADAADALALALCHIWRGASSDRLTGALAAAADQAERQRRAYAAVRSAAKSTRQAAGQPAARRPKP